MIKEPTMITWQKSKSSKFVQPNPATNATSRIGFCRWENFANFLHFQDFLLKIQFDAEDKQPQMIYTYAYTVHMSANHLLCDYLLLYLDYLLDKLCFPFFWLEMAPKNVSEFEFFCFPSKNNKNVTNTLNYFKTQILNSLCTLCNDESFFINLKKKTGLHKITQASLNI